MLKTLRKLLETSQNMLKISRKLPKTPRMLPKVVRKIPEDSGKTFKTPRKLLLGNFPKLQKSCKKLLGKYMRLL